MPLNQQLQFMESQAAHIESAVRVIEHGTTQYQELVDINREASPHADGIVYYSSDGTGEMVDIANRATDIPLVQVSLAQHNVPIQHKALAYDWSDRELGRAMYLGANLVDRKVVQAFRIAEETKDKVFLYGDTNYGWDGMVNNTNITIEAAAGSWETATDEQIFSDVNELIGAAWAGTNAVRICDTLLLPMQALYRLNRPMGADAHQSVYQYIMKNNPYTAVTGKELMIRVLRQLATASAAGARRAIVYPRNRSVLRFHVPQELQFIEPQRDGMGYIYHGWMALAGLEIMEPNAMRYLDGI